MDKFTTAPAGMKNHHAYKGGLLEHVVSLMELVLVVAPRYPQLDQDKLLVGAFLHDAAKVDELSYDRDIAYTDEGQMLGHMMHGHHDARRQSPRSRAALRRADARSSLSPRSST